jgi:chemotaxis signal transduction protein
MREFVEGTDSPTPVMTFRAAGAWLAVPVERMNRIVTAGRLVPVPLAHHDHAGLLQTADKVVPVMQLAAPTEKGHEDQLVALLNIRGEIVGVTIDAAGRVYRTYHRRADTDAPPVAIAASQPVAAQAEDCPFWLIDPDRLWPHASPGGADLAPSA